MSWERSRATSKGPAARNAEYEHVAGFNRVTRRSGNPETTSRPACWSGSPTRRCPDAPRLFVDART